MDGSSWSPSLLFAGKYGTEIRPVFWLNFIFLFFPVWGAVTLFTKPKDRPLIGGYNVSPTCERADVEMFRRKKKKNCLLKILCDAAHK